MFIVSAKWIPLSTPSIWERTLDCSALLLIKGPKERKDVTDKQHMHSVESHIQILLYNMFQWSRTGIKMYDSYNSYNSYNVNLIRQKVYCDRDGGQLHISKEYSYFHCFFAVYLCPCWYFALQNVMTWKQEERGQWLCRCRRLILFLLTASNCWDMARP